MIFPRLARRVRAQTTSEYMILLATVSIAALVALEMFSKPGSPVQVAGENLAQNYEKGLSNTDDGNMSAQ